MVVAEVMEATGEVSSANYSSKGSMQSENL